MTKDIKNLKGFRDIFSQELQARDKIISTVREVYESYGFIPLATPSLEAKETLFAYGDAVSKQIFHFKDPDEKEVGLIYDLTVPLARVVTQYKDLQRPFKRYQIQTVWRYDKPDPGRFREFIQFDIDTVGVESVIADAEIIAAMNDCLENLDLNFQIRLMNRKILNCLIKFAGIDENLSKDVFRVIDKIDKKGIEGVKEELMKPRCEKKGTAFAGKVEEFGVGLNKTQVSKIEEFINLPQKTRKEAINSVEKLFKSIPEAVVGIEELKEVDEFLSELNIKEGNVVIDFTIARGLDYYTGLVYEAILTDLKEYGSVMGGGRYDDLIGIFCNEKIPATGASIGVDRLSSSLQKLEKIKTKPATADVFITVMMKDKMIEYQKLARRLRKEGIKTEVYIGQEKSISNQLKYADKLSIPIAIIIGPDEFAKNEVSIKDLRQLKKEKVETKDRQSYLKMRLGQKTVPMDKLISELKSLLE